MLLVQLQISIHLSSLRKICKLNREHRKKTDETRYYYTDVVSRLSMMLLLCAKADDLVLAKNSCHELLNTFWSPAINRVIISFKSSSNVSKSGDIRFFAIRRFGIVNLLGGNLFFLIVFCRCCYTSPWLLLVPLLIVISCIIIGPRWLTKSKSQTNQSIL